MICDNDPPAVYTQAMRRARSPHVCCECRMPIPAGNTYEHVDGLWDGRWEHFDTCLFCSRRRTETQAALRAAGECDRIPFGDLWGDLSS